MPCPNLSITALLPTPGPDPFLSPPPGKSPLLQPVPPFPGVPQNPGAHLLCFVQLISQELRALFPDLHRGAAQPGHVELLRGVGFMHTSSILASTLWLLFVTFGWHQGLPESHSGWILALFLQIDLAGGNSTGKMSVGVIQSLPPTLTTHPGTGSGNEAGRVMGKNLGSNSCTCSFALQPYGSALPSWQGVLINSG